MPFQEYTFVIFYVNRNPAIRFLECELRFELFQIFVQAQKARLFIAVPISKTREFFLSLLMIGLKRASTFSCLSVSIFMEIFVPISRCIVVTSIASLPNSALNFSPLSWPNRRVSTSIVEPSKKHASAPIPKRPVLAISDPASSLTNDFFHCGLLRNDAPVLRK